MDTSDLISRPALRRSPQSSEPLIRDESTRPSVFPAHIARGIAGFAALFSGVAWRATSDLTRTGFARLISHAAILGVTVGAIVISADATNSAQSSGIRGSQEVRNTALSAAPTAENQIADYPIYAAGGALLYQQSDIIRQADPYTIIPDRPRRGVEEYTVQPGDILFTIANRFGVSPETILWNNQDTLDNDPHRILPGTKLIIPPVSGIIHTVQEGDTLEALRRLTRPPSMRSSSTARSGTTCSTAGSRRRAARSSYPVGSASSKGGSRLGPTVSAPAAALRRPWARARTPAAGCKAVALSSGRRMVTG